MEKIEKMFQQLDENMKSMNSKFDAFTLEMTQIKEENEKLKEKVRKQEDRIESLEREIRSKNIVVKGVLDEERENENTTKEKIGIVMQKIGVCIEEERDIDDIRRIGKYRNDRNRPILVKLTKSSTRSKILKSARELKGTEIWIDEDFPKNIQEERRTLIPQLKMARDKGYRAVLKYNKLVIDGEIYGPGKDEQSNITRHKEGEEAGNVGQKRTVTERSPEGCSIEEKFQKIAKTMTQKN